MNKKLHPVFESLEDRILLSGTPMGEEVAIQIDLNKQTELHSSAINISEILIIDESVENYEELIAHLDKETLKIHFIDSNVNGLEEITEILSHHKSLDAVHILSHGSAGSISLGNTELNTEILEENKELISSWSKALTENADLLLYGCDLASNVQGQNFVDQLAHITALTTKI